MRGEGGGGRECWPEGMQRRGLYNYLWANLVNCHTNLAELGIGFPGLAAADLLDTDLIIYMNVRSEHCYRPRART